MLWSRNEEAITIVYKNINFLIRNIVILVCVCVRDRERERASVGLPWLTLCETHDRELVGEF